MQDQQTHIRKVSKSHRSNQNYSFERNGYDIEKQRKSKGSELKNSIIKEKRVKCCGSENKFNRSTRNREVA